MLDLGECRRRGEGKVLRDEELRLGLVQRPQGIPDEDEHRRVGPPPRAFGEVGHDRDGRATQLGGEPETLVARKARRQPIDGEGELMRLLPGFELAIVPHHYSAAADSGDYYGRR